MLHLLQPLEAQMAQVRCNPYVALEKKTQAAQGRWTPRLAVATESQLARDHWL